jgi:hypothetical protein
MELLEKVDRPPSNQVKMMMEILNLVNIYIPIKGLVFGGQEQIKFQLSTDLRMLQDLLIGIQLFLKKNRYLID